jgi:hypothetical protein
VSETKEQELQHALGNARAETAALKSLLGKAAERLEDIVAEDCSDESQKKALATAQRLRIVIDRTQNKDDLGGLPEASDQPSA